MISNSYPYLSISKKHDVDYGRVLAAAHVLTHGSQDAVRDLLNATSDSETGILVDIQEAVLHYKGIQSGVIPFPTT